MRLFALLLVLLGGWGSLTRIHDLNEAVQQAGHAYKAGRFAAAARLYKEAVRYNPADEAVLLNLGHASAQSGQAAEARAAYGRLLSSRTPAVRSIAQQQLAVLASRKGDYAQALSLLRQALQANAANAGARYNYEVISDYLARRQTDPDIPPPATDDSPPSTNGQPDNDQQPSPSRQPRAGQDQQGQLNDPDPRQDPRSAPQPRPNQQGQQDPNRPTDQAGSTADSNFQPGQGAERNVAQGTEPGTTRGLSNQPTGPQATAGSSRQPGTEAAALDEAQLQTQRARLQQMNLSSGQAQQVLDALSAAEQQYIQQLPRSSPGKPDPKKPAW
ncbi:tetratricopeptide repeat protein [Hymenobacter psychrotolerans]|uniref:Tetratricopeptide repeat-containing protein n=1 Tax=Hymenobacter psychrotolerans DSM 18569 TaxID=1121959 RepID=A0A1M7FDX0_9BACT|nr:tetratricopeptide repeat protein [Hymenobacter psychrotolerans]SHM02251.1 Tetratricopeptide repeat-containing protein [Hymenobacter psychrotolerans DSM 18569]